MKNILIGLVILLTVNGCAVSNEGAVDFRRTEPYTKASPEGTTDKCKTIDDKNCNKPLEYKNFDFGKNSTIEKNDFISLHLKSAFIKTFSENKVTPWVTKAFTRGWRKANGEIAIVANAGQIEGSSTDLKQNDQRSGRVVFYSNDVREGQFLNFNNMPIYGPMTYKGVPFGFRVAIFELDETNETNKAMFKTLADLGSKAYPPASPALNVLNQMGQLFAGKDGTDTEFRYSMILDPTNGGVRDHFSLASGNYVLVRAENRETKIEWNNLCLNLNEGRLYKKPKDDNKTCAESTLTPYTDETYLVVEIAKNIGSVEVQLENNNFEQLRKSLQLDNENFAKKISESSAVIANEIEREVRKSTLEDLQNISYLKGIDLIASIKRYKLQLIAEQNSAAKAAIKLEGITAAKSVAKLITASLDANGNYKTNNLQDPNTFSPLKDEHVDYFLTQPMQLSITKDVDIAPAIARFSREQFVKTPIDSSTIF